MEKDWLLLPHQAEIPSLDTTTQPSVFQMLKTCFDSPGNMYFDIFQLGALTKTLEQKSVQVCWREWGTAGSSRGQVSFTSLQHTEQCQEDCPCPETGHSSNQIRNCRRCQAG